MSMIGELVSGVAHQVRNRLFGISSTLDACEQEHGRRPGIGEYVQTLRGETARLSRLMTHLLDYGEKESVAREETLFSEVVASAISSSRATAREAGVTVRASIPEGLPLLSLDPDRLQRALHNLIENAVQHSRRGGQVRVTVREESRHAATTLVCDIDDDGPGFRSGDERHLFEPFFSRRSSGTGLGMSIAQRIVLEHGGRIAAANRPEGGARLTIELPVPASLVSSGVISA
jgi:signal transduction histidine kinase